MLPLAYTQSVELKNTLHDIDMLRSELLSIPLSPKNNTRLRWESKATRIYSSLALAQHLLSRGQVVKILGSKTKHIPSEYRDVLSYKKALEYIEDTWSANTRPVTTSIITTIASLALPRNVEAIDRAMISKEPEIRATLEYLETQVDHPVIQAGIALCLFTTSASLLADAGVTARLVTYMYLCKYGYDCRGLMTIEKQWLSSGASYEMAIANHEKQGSLNHMLMYIAQTIEQNLKERIQDVTASKLHQDFPAAFWELSDRQKIIIRELEEPTSSMTNKKVQQLFSISQITASRDLTKLATLGLVTSHGKGRSVSYTLT